MLDGDIKWNTVEAQRLVAERSINVGKHYYLLRRDLVRQLPAPLFSVDVRAVTSSRGSLETGPGTVAEARKVKPISIHVMSVNKASADGGATLVLHAIKQKCRTQKDLIPPAASHFVSYQPAEETCCFSPTPKACCKWPCPFDPEALLSNAVEWTR